MRRSWYIVTAAVLIAAFLVSLSAVLYEFRRASDTMYYLFIDLTFLPLQVLIVTLILNRLLEVRERNELGQRVNIVISVFFNEMGIDLLRYLSQFDVSLDEMRAIAGVNEGWTSRNFATMRKRLVSYDYSIDCHCADIEDLRGLLRAKHEAAFAIISNPSLLEQESFTELMWAILHLERELQYRPNLDDLSDADYAHLGSDMRRVYVLLVVEWLSFAERLKQSQPYSFSLAVRLNPLAQNPSANVDYQ